MSYVNGKEVLPEDILTEIQKYYNGGLIYIPTPEEQRCKWGTRTTTKHDLKKRNQEICWKRKNGASIHALMDEYHLAYDTIKKIIYKQ